MFLPTDKFRKLCGFIEKGGYFFQLGKRWLHIFTLKDMFIFQNPGKTNPSSSKKSSQILPVGINLYLPFTLVLFVLEAARYIAKSLDFGVG